jgi:hypothetical protein
MASDASVSVDAKAPTTMKEVLFTIATVESSTNVIELLNRNDPVLGLQSLRLTVHCAVD